MAKMRRKRGRGIKKRSNMGGAVCKASIIIVAGLFAALGYWRSTSIVLHRRDRVKEAEARLEKLAGDLKREEAKWDEMTSVATFDKALSSRGIAMAHATGRQIVYMDRQGRAKDGVGVAFAREAIARAGRTKPRLRR